MYIKILKSSSQLLSAKQYMQSFSKLELEHFEYYSPLHYCVYNKVLIASQFNYANVISKKNRVAKF